MKDLRRAKVSAFLRNEIAQILQFELKDPRIGFLSVVSVMPTEDLKEAVVKVSLMGTPSEQRTTMRGLQAAQGYVQSLLGSRTSFRHTPQLRFVQDETIQKGMEFESLLQKTREEDQDSTESPSERHQEVEEGSVDDFRDESGPAFLSS